MEIVGAMSSPPGRDFSVAETSTAACDGASKSASSCLARRLGRVVFLLLLFVPGAGRDTAARDHRDAGAGPFPPDAGAICVFLRRVKFCHVG